MIKRTVRKRNKAGGDKYDSDQITCLKWKMEVRGAPCTCEGATLIAGGVDCYLDDNSSNPQPNMCSGNGIGLVLGQTINSNGVKVFTLRGGVYGMRQYGG